MSTTHHVKMAKASQKDLDGAIELYQFLEAMRDGLPAADAVEEFGYKGYGDLVDRKADDAEFLLRAHERGGLFRVAWGLQVLLDPRNEVVDPNLPHLELHPKHEQAAKDRDAARAELEQWPRQIAAALCTTAIDDRSPTTWAGHVRREHEANTACFDRLVKARAEAEKLRAELAAVRRQRDELAKFVVRYGEACEAHDWACAQCKPNSDVLVDGFVCAYHEAKALAAEQPAAAQQPAPIEPRPWWVVFGLERHAASRMVASAPNSGPLLVDMSLRHLADDANKRGVHPTEIARALDEARAELQPKPQGGA